MNTASAIYPILLIRNYGIISSRLHEVCQIFFQLPHFEYKVLPRTAAFICGKNRVHAINSNHDATPQHMTVKKTSEKYMNELNDMWMTSLKPKNSN